MRYVAFLRGMNLGGRRITNDELCTCFVALGLRDVWAYQAAGNVVFDSRITTSKLARLIEGGLRDELGYDVPVFLRSAEEVAAIAAAEPFSDSRGSAGGKVQVGMLREEPSSSARDAALSHATAADRLAILGRDLYWLPAGGVSESDLEFRAIDRALGSMTVRTQGTIQRLAKKLT